MGDIPNFYVLAPEFVCPNDKDAVIDKPDTTIITVKTDAADLQLNWTVRWVQLEKPTQRFTLLLWQTVRFLEAKLNAPQPEPFVYVIDNTELLQGVEYVFNVTAFDSTIQNSSTTKTFSIDNVKGDSTLLLEGRSKKLSVILIGGNLVYVDMEYVVQAEVTVCTPTQDYYFAWAVQNSLASPLSHSNKSGSRLEIPPYSLQAGGNYYISCAVFRNSGELVTETGLPLQVLYRGLEVSLSFDVLVVTANKRFDVRALIVNDDRYEETLKFVWTCSYENQACKNFEGDNGQMMTFYYGLPDLGSYEISVTVTVQDKISSSCATVIVIDTMLPIIQIEPQPRIVNEHGMVTLRANVSDVVPSCNLTWYFADEDYLASLHFNACLNCQHGQELSGSLSITSLEENFLNELTDFTNESEWKQLEAEVNASTGRARLVVHCGCSLTFQCDNQGIVYADINFEINKSPKVANIKILPEEGTAMETVFRLSTMSASDPNRPLLYSFYCNLSTDTSTNDNLLLASNLEHSATETFLPFIDPNGTRIWVEVCDSRGACSSSKIKTVRLAEGAGRTLPTLLIFIEGHVNRCEITPLLRLVKSAMYTYVNANQEVLRSTFTQALAELLPSSEDHCLQNYSAYHTLVDWLRQRGMRSNSSLL